MATLRELLDELKRLRKSRHDILNERDRLREAIEAWTCPACSGSGIRENSDVEHYETVACYKCAWKRAALEAGEDKVNPMWLDRGREGQGGVNG